MAQWIQYRKTIQLILYLIVAGFINTHFAEAQDRGKNFIIGEYLKLNSQILNEERTMIVHVPDGYEQGQASYPVLYLLDGDWNDLFITVVGTSGYLNELGIIPKIIVVGIGNTDRSRDMLPVKLDGAPTSGGAPYFLRFISEELKPFIEKRYRTEPFTILFGGSSAGIFTLYTFLEEPEAFRAYIASSPGIGINPDYFLSKAKDLFEKESSLPQQMYLVYGENDYPSCVNHTSDFYDAIKPLAPDDLKCHLEIIKNEGHVPFIGLYNGLRFIFSEWTFPEDRRAEAGLDEFKRHFHEVSKKYGYNVIIPEDLLIGLGYWSIRRDELPAAIEALRLACELHPYSPNGFYYLGEAYEKNNQVELALKNYKKALEVEPSFQLATRKINEHEKK